MNPAHPDKYADRIAGVIVDFAYVMQKDPKISVEVMLGHHDCFIIAETSVHILMAYVEETVGGSLGKDLKSQISRSHRIRFSQVIRKVSSAAVTTGFSGGCRLLMSRGGSQPLQGTSIPSSLMMVSTYLMETA